LSHVSQAYDDACARADKLASQLREIGANGSAGGGAGGGEARAAAMWSEEDVQERVQRLETRWQREGEEEREALREAFGKERSELERSMVTERKESSEQLQRKEAELRESSSWAQEKGKEAADLRIESRKLRERVSELDKVLRDSQQQVKHLNMSSATRAPPRVAAMLSHFREGLRDFRDGLSSWKEDVRHDS
jgi:chromosome segregation ATPase